ncbi:MAG: hypothetical protein JKY65_08175 [Planctomycetes bacterium]|nr:hypothetical protein [Planctomycetota bacterium]
MRNRLHAYLAPAAPAPARAQLVESLWTEANKALLVGDLYLSASPERHDSAIGLGAKLVELAERLELAPAGLAPLTLLAATETALAQANRVLAPLAPQA